MTQEQRVDTYLENAAPFARAILQHLRELVLCTCPEAEEKMRWGMPFFDYHGSMMCSVAAFSRHAAFGFWKAVLMNDPDGWLASGDAAGMGSLGKIGHLRDLPPDDVLISFIRQAMRLNEDGITLPSKGTRKRGIGGLPAETEPEPLLAALAESRAAKACWDAFAPSQRKDYISWITAAKTAATRDKRVLQTIEWVAQGRVRFWKYKQ